jgi:iron uptake system EfeUOB component EfeO/EfeM
MTDSQLLAIALASAPTMITVLIGILINNARLGDLRHYMDARFNGVNERFNDIDRRFEDLDRKMDYRFDDMKSMWRSELHRVEEVLDARLKHLEERA